MEPDLDGGPITVTTPVPPPPSGEESGTADGAQGGNEVLLQVFAPPVAIKSEPSPTQQGRVSASTEMWGVKASAHLPKSAAGQPLPPLDTGTVDQSDVAMDCNPSLSPSSESDEDTVPFTNANSSANHHQSPRRDDSANGHDLASEFGAWLLERGVGLGTSQRATSEIEAVLDDYLPPVASSAACVKADVLQVLERRADEVMSRHGTGDVFFQAAFGLFSHYLAAPPPRMGCSDTGGSLAVLSLLDILKRQQQQPLPSSSARAKPGRKRAAGGQGGVSEGEAWGKEEAAAMQVDEDGEDGGEEEEEEEEEDSGDEDEDEEEAEQKKRGKKEGKGRASSQGRRLGRHKVKRSSHSEHPKYSTGPSWLRAVVKGLMPQRSETSWSNYVASLQRWVWQGKPPASGSFETLVEAVARERTRVIEALSDKHGSSSTSRSGLRVMVQRLLDSGRLSKSDWWDEEHGCWVFAKEVARRHWRTTGGGGGGRRRQQQAVMGGDVMDDSDVDESSEEEEEARPSLGGGRQQRARPSSLSSSPPAAAVVMDAARRRECVSVVLADSDCEGEDEDEAERRLDWVLRHLPPHLPPTGSSSSRGGGTYRLSSDQVMRACREAYHELEAEAHRQGRVGGRGLLAAKALATEYLLREEGEDEARPRKKKGVGRKAGSSSSGGGDGGKRKDPSRAAASSSSSFSSSSSTITTPSAARRRSSGGGGAQAPRSSSSSTPYTPRLLPADDGKKKKKRQRQEEQAEAEAAGGEGKKKRKRQEQEAAGGGEGGGKKKRKMQEQQAEAADAAGGGGKGKKQDVMGAVKEVAGGGGGGKKKSSARPAMVKRQEQQEAEAAGGGGGGKKKKAMRAEAAEGKQQAQARGSKGAGKREPPSEKEDGGLMVPGLWCDELKASNVKRQEVEQVVEAIGRAAGRTKAPYFKGMEELHRELRQRASSKEAEDRAVFKALEERGLKSALSAVKDVVRCWYTGRALEQGRMVPLGPVVAVTPPMHSELVEWMARHGDHGTLKPDLLLRRLADCVLVPEVLGFSLRREVMNWSSLKARLLDSEEARQASEQLARGGGGEGGGCSSMRPALKALQAFLREHGEKKKNNHKKKEEKKKAAGKG